MVHKSVSVLIKLSLNSPKPTEGLIAPTRIRSSTDQRPPYLRPPRARPAREQGREEARSICRRTKLPDESRPPLLARRGREPTRFLCAESRGRVVPLLRIEGRWRQPGSTPSGRPPGRAELGKRGGRSSREGGRLCMGGSRGCWPAGRGGREVAGGGTKGDVTPDFTRKTECISYVRQDQITHT
jgi:hypothetical protein